MYYAKLLVDSGFLIAYYSAGDRYHQQVSSFLETCTAQLITTPICVTEVMWLLSADWRVQNEFLLDLVDGIYKCICLNSTDFSRISQLNKQYRDLPGDFADLSLVAISERLNLEAIATLDSDFDIYRRYRSQPFVRVFLPN